MTTSQYTPDVSVTATIPSLRSGDRLTVSRGDNVVQLEEGDTKISFDMRDLNASLAILGHKASPVYRGQQVEREGASVDRGEHRG